MNYILGLVNFWLVLLIIKMVLVLGSSFSVVDRWGCLRLFIFGVLINVSLFCSSGLGVLILICNILWLLVCGV